MKKQTIEKWNTGDIWICEDHRDKIVPHDDCKSPGMPPTPQEHSLIQQALFSQKESWRKEINQSMSGACSSGMCGHKNLDPNSVNHGEYIGRNKLGWGLLKKL